MAYQNGVENINFLLRARDNAKLPFTLILDVGYQNKNINNQKTESCANNGLHSNKNSSANITKSAHSDGSAQKQPKPRQKYLHCVSCNSPFSNAWDLMVHVQAAHMMNIYQLADSNKLQQVKFSSYFYVTIV